MSLIDFNKVTIGYDGKSVISDLTFQIKPNEYVCIVGENGSGKTTLMKCLLGLIPPLSGKITFGDGLTQNEIGYLPQKTVLQKDFPASRYCTRRCSHFAFSLRRSLPLLKLMCNLQIFDKT